LTNSNQNSILNSIVRRARVQNYVVPAYGQTPAGTELLRRNPSPSSLLQSTSGFTSSDPNNNNLPNYPVSNPNFLNPALRAQLIRRNFINPSIANLGGIIVTPENQRTVGQYIFTDPNVPTSPRARAENNPVVAASAQKIFILPSDDDQPSNDPNNPNNNRKTSLIKAI
jgi:hypothetical protein